MNLVLDTLFLRRPKIDYISPAICEALFSSSGGPVIVLNEIGKRPGPTGGIVGGSGHNQLSWNAYPGALCYNIYSAVYDVTSIEACQQLVAQSATVSYQILQECYEGTTLTIPHQGCFRISAITPDGESDLSDPICSCDFSDPFVDVCNDEQTAECPPGTTGDPVTIPAGTFCLSVANNPASIAAAKAGLNNIAMQQAEHDLDCSGGPPGPGLLAYWKLDEVTGVRQDCAPCGNRNTCSSCVNPNDLTEIEGAVGDAAGVINQGAAFTGGLLVGNYLRGTVPLDLTNDFSISMWVKPTGNDGAFFDNFDPGTNKGQFQAIDTAAVDTGAAAMFSVTGAAMSQVFFTITFGVFNHLVFTWDASAQLFSVYHNGVFENSDNNPGTLEPTFGAPQLGASASNPFRWGGTLDEVGVWNRILSPAEITTLYNAGAGLALTDTNFPG